MATEKSELSLDAVANEPGKDAASIARARWLFAQSAQFERGAVTKDHLPTPDRPEVAFAGRSNVGKSTLLNALSNQKDLARTSNTPGRTREINFFLLSDGIRLVDLPGYGYARASKQDIKNWIESLFDYLRGRANLRRVFLLVDGRHGIKPPDRNAMKILDDAAVSFQIVLTKADKIKPTEVEKTLAQATAEARNFNCSHPIVLMVSSHKKTGLGDLELEISNLTEWDLITYPTLPSEA